MVAIHIDAVSKSYPASAKSAPPAKAVDAVSLQIPSGELFFLLGPSGCGKTTLLRMIAGFITPTTGRILFNNADISRLPPHLRDAGMVFQSYALWPHMTVADNVAFGLDCRKIAGPQRSARIDEALRLVQMEEYRTRKPNQLSGGQQQRVALARALAIRPKCLLLDEPLSNLDAKLRLDMRSEIRRIVKQAGITAIYVTHDQKEALSMADRVALLKSGKLQQVGTPADLYRNPVSRFVANFIGEANFIPATIQSINGQIAILQTPFATLTAQLTSNHFHPGAKILAAFRPESVTFAPAHENQIAATRLSTTYLGEMAEHLIELPDKSRIKAYQINPPIADPAPGPVNISIPPQNIMLVQDQD